MVQGLRSTSSYRGLEPLPKLFSIIYIYIYIFFFFFCGGVPVIIVSRVYPKALFT